MSLVRKISIGRDYKNDAMHYAVGQEVYGGHTICDIVEESEKAMIIEQTGTTDQLDALEKQLKKFGIIEMIRSGKLVMARGKEPT